MSIILNELFGKKKKKKTIEDYISVVKNTNDKFDEYFDASLMDKLIDNAKSVEEGIKDKVTGAAKAAVFMGVLAAAFMQISNGVISIMAGDEINHDDTEQESDDIMQAVVPDNVVAKLKTNDKMLKSIAEKFQLTFGDNEDLNLKNAYYFVNQNQSIFDSNENYNNILEAVDLDKKELNKAIALFITKYSESIMGDISYDDIDNEEDGYGE